MTSIWQLSEAMWRSVIFHCSFSGTLKTALNLVLQFKQKKNSSKFLCPFVAHYHKVYFSNSWASLLGLVSTMSSGYAPFCNKISIGILDFVLSAYIRGVRFRIASGMLTSKTGNDRSFLYNWAVIGGCQMKCCSAASVWNIYDCFIFQTFFDTWDVVVQKGAMNFLTFCKHPVKNISCYFVRGVEMSVWNEIFTLRKIFSKQFSRKIFCKTSMHKMQFSIRHSSYYSKLLYPLTLQEPVRLLHVEGINCPKEPVFSLVENKDIKAAIMCFPKYDSFSLFYFWFWALHCILFTEVNIAFFSWNFLNKSSNFNFFGKLRSSFEQYSSTCFPSLSLKCCENKLSNFFANFLRSVNMFIPVLFVKLNVIF